MILVNGDSFTAGEESQIAWPQLLNAPITNLAQSGASNDYIVRSTMEHFYNTRAEFAIIAWTTPNRIEISGKHLTPTSQGRYGNVVDAVFADWDEEWAWNKFKTQVIYLHRFLAASYVKHFFVSTFDIQNHAEEKIPGGAPWLGWPNEGLVEWMGDCPKGPGGHPLELGHQRIAEKINEHIRTLGWI